MGLQKAFPRRQSSLPIVNRGLISETGIIPAGYQYIRDNYRFKMTNKPQTMMIEDVNGKKTPVMVVTGLFQEGEIQNANGRVYPRPVLAEATRVIQDDISRRAVYGELDHPQDAKIHMDRVSHLVTKAWMDQNKIYGQAEILDNQFHGAALRGLFERKCQVGISSRGVGDMEMRESSGKQFYEVLPGYSFVTWDAVAEPSVHGATLNVMEELNRRARPIQEARNNAIRQNNLLEAHNYERMLVDTVHKFFETKPIARPADKIKKRSYFGL